MSETPMEITKIVEPETFPMKPVERIVSIFVSPGALTANIKTYPKAWVPMLVCILISVASLPFTLRVADIQLQQLSIASIDRYGVDYFSIGAAFDDDGFMQTTINTVTVISTAVGLVVSYPAAAVFAALLLFILCKLMRGPAMFQHYFSLYAHVYVISAICGLVSMAGFVAFGNMLDILSLAAVFMPDGDNANMLFNVLSAINIPAIWTTVLIVIGLKNINEWPAEKALIAGTAAFLFSVAFTAASLGASFYMIDWFDSVLFTL
jgi:hypothetical protein